MNDITGEKLITAAYLFGGGGLAFTILPFLGVIVYGITKANQGGNHNKSADIFSIVAWALVVHTLSTFLYFGLIQILDKTSLDTPNYYTTKVFPIFWAETKAQVLSLAGVTLNDDVLSGVAYSTLNLLQTVRDWIFISLPLIISILAFVYGFVLSSRDSYDSNIISVGAYTIVSFIVVGSIYLFWALISSYALFMPSGMNILKMVAQIWANLFNV